MALPSDMLIKQHDNLIAQLIDANDKSTVTKKELVRKLIETSSFTAEFFGNLYKNNNKKFINYYKVYISQISYLLKEIGININTVPVLDIRRAGSNNIIGDRSYSSYPKNVSKIGDFCIQEFKKEKIANVIKHIPGHGLAKVDSHKKTPIVKNSKKYLLKNDFSTFRNKKTFFAMTAHVVYTKIDPINTATHSKKIINIIRRKIGYKNIIITDDISMKSLKSSLKINTLKAISAGCNLVLHCNGRYNEMINVAENSPFISPFVSKKTTNLINIFK